VTPRKRAASRLTRGACAATCAIAALATAGPAGAQSDNASLPLFADTSTLSFTLEAPLRALRRDSERRRPERDGFVRYSDAAGEEVVLDVEVRVRGRSRLAGCDFPPLRLDFRRRQLDGTVFEGQNRLKLVTLCKARDNYRDYLQLEYDVYRLFNVLTDYSFRVRPVGVEYVSTDSRREETFREAAFLIESDSEVAARHGMDVIEQQSFRIAEVNARHAALLSVFQYMIGNTDWSIFAAAGSENCCHNADVIGSDNGRVFALPYDFDQSGLISTEYAEPPEQLRLRNVRQRLYRGACAFNPELDSVFALIEDRRAELEQVFRSSNAGADAREDAFDYFQEALVILADADQRNEAILEECR
jgi:hypothetical protein